MRVFVSYSRVDLSFVDQVDMALRDSAGAGAAELRSLRCGQGWSGLGVLFRAGAPRSGLAARPGVVAAERAADGTRAGKEGGAIGREVAGWRRARRSPGLAAEH